MESRIKNLIDSYPLEEVFYLLDITPERVIEVLDELGYIDLEDLFLDDYLDYEEEYEEEDDGSNLE